ncbi:MAG TPA: GerMN domain-containing protein [Candidatus Aminicenantes bacterium]|nr:GerMN domain-containing protein [Candidatus Aminicenantes bacterium]HRY64003.1 GerMN domain-containing protein [Candidatus Aminicenantes bacterium]HRZ70916.1 GerMN domain-containing protein [Candidatus Aminicenantes bacterium]
MAAKKRKKGGISRSALVLTFLILALAVLVIIFFNGQGGEKVKRGAEAVAPKARTEAKAKPVETRAVTLFFVADDDDLLHKETRTIPAGPNEADEAERALAELIRGSEEGLSSPLPARTRVRQVFIAKDGVATVDLSRDVAENFAYGSTSELAAVYAVVNTLVYNFKPVKKVVFLVEGAERETLGGHVDLTRAFFPDYSLVAR